MDKSIDDVVVVVVPLLYDEVLSMMSIVVGRFCS